METENQEIPKIPENILTTNFKKSFYTSIAGAISGNIYAIITQQSKLALSFSMGTNWFLLSLPFYNLRSAMIYAAPTDNSKTFNQLWASALSGGIMGLGLGYYSRGPRAIFPSFLLYGSLAFIGQSIYSVGHYYRLRRSVDLLNESTEISSNNNDIPWYKIKFRNVPDGSLPTVYGKNWDPARDLFDSMFNMIKRNIDVPEWASPLVMAFDLEYRKKLNMEIDRLYEEIYTLRKELNLAVPDTLPEKYNKN